MSEAQRILLNSIGLLIFGSGLSFMAARYWWQRNEALRLAAVTEKKAADIAAQHAALLARVAELETKLALVNQAVIPISTAFQAILIKELTHFHTPEMDALMLKIGPPNTMTPEELDRFAVLLEERTRDMGPEISDAEREAAMILPIVIKRAQREADAIERVENTTMNLGKVVGLLGVPHLAPALSPAPALVDAAKSLHQIEENTGKTAEALQALTTRVVQKVSEKVVKTRRADDSGMGPADRRAIGWPPKEP